MMNGTSIVIVDDDERLRNRLASHLTREGFGVTAVDSAAVMRDLVRRERVDLALVDVTLPGEDGLSLTRFLREHAKIGVIILSGMSTPVDRVVGLEVGADDYIAKPFDLPELVARIRSVLRRTQAAATAELPPDPPIVCFAGWRLDWAKRELTSARRKPVHLTAAEFHLLSALVARPNEVIDRSQMDANLAGQKEIQPVVRLSPLDQHLAAGNIADLAVAQQSCQIFEIHRAKQIDVGQLEFIRLAETGISWKAHPAMVALCRHDHHATQRFVMPLHTDSLSV